VAREDRIKLRQRSRLGRNVRKQPPQARSLRRVAEQ
jgi:hypothetical protein